ncbi:GNAT family N-acetyltransferase [Chitinolyticbacter meiyuanensis]|uniref:GNAT family N-acetyltransferase n=1 Tax=Chitinolyticbacter meiyuanensis TaxID=682798 RepID=UPI0011E5A1DB|nr:GNAT family N-acetyltransferase [Chitinolyticbacter meiyuanensis]
MNIRTLTTLPEIKPFFPMLGHAEYSAFDLQNPSHSAWLQTRVDKLLYCGAFFFAMFSDYNRPCAIASVLIDERPIELGGHWQSAEIMQMAVSEELRKQGHGSRLIQHICMEMQKQRVYSISLHTYPADYDVIAFYGKNDFMPCGLVPDHYGPNLEGKLYLRKVLLPVETRVKQTT